MIEKSFKKTLQSAILLIAGAAVLIPVVASADGIFVPPPTERVYETEQEAVIFYEDGQEDLIITTSFQGNAEEFAWIVPTPTIPTLQKGSWEIFVALREISTQGQQIPELAGYGDLKAFDAMELFVNEDSVREIERTTVGYYDVAVLEARTTAGLLEWFEENDFEYPKQGDDILDEYIDAGWYFSAVRINPDDITPATKNKVSSGETLPLHFHFATDRIVYPLKMSQAAVLYNAPLPDEFDEEDSDWLLNKNTSVGTTKLPTQPKNMPITLYILADSKKSLYGFTEQYAGWISGDVVSELSFNAGGQPTLVADTDEKYVLTKLYDSVKISEMTYDLYPRDEENVGLLNDQDRISTKKFAVWAFIIVASAAALVLIATIVIIGREPSEKK